MKLIIVTGIWKRHALTAQVLRYYADLVRGFDIGLVCVGSEGDASRRLAEDAGWNYLEHANAPLSQKFNAVVEATRQFNPDAVMMTGSDDLHSARYIDNAMRIDTSFAHMKGLRDLYFYNLLTKDCLRHNGFIGKRSAFSIGAGRVLTRPALDRLDFRPWGTEKINRGLDLTLSARLRVIGIPESAHSMDDLGASVDLKSEENLTSMETFIFNADRMDPSVILRTFGGTIQKITEAWQS